MPSDPTIVLILYVGGSVLGTAFDQLYEPEGLIRQSVANGQEVVFVGMNYRLGSMLD